MERCQQWLLILAAAKPAEAKTNSLKEAASAFDVLPWTNLPKELRVKVLNQLTIKDALSIGKTLNNYKK